MRYVIFGAFLAALALIGRWVLEKETRDAKHRAWMVDHNRRIWAEGLGDGAPPWKWAVMRRRHEEHPRYGLHKRAR